MGGIAQIVGSQVPKAMTEYTVTPIDKRPKNSIENRFSQQGFAGRFSRVRARFLVLNY
ncbi:MAG TPA: hypothetical protein VMV69_12680 [Pirellulales bacterium]|nr:hypothetical protein [Pirellulales bacterium]